MNITNPLEAAKADAIAKLVALPVPRLSPFATADEINSVKDCLEGLIAAVDPFIAALGHEFVSSTSGVGIKCLHLYFTDQLRGALEGNALYELESAAEIAEQEYAEAAE